MPVEKNVIWEELNPNGDADAASMRSSVNDGLFWTPFDDGVDNSDKVNAEVKSMDLWVENTGIT